LSAGLFRLVLLEWPYGFRSTVEMLFHQHKANIVRDVIEGSFQIGRQSEKSARTAPDEWNRCS